MDSVRALNGVKNDNIHLAKMVDYGKQDYLIYAGGRYTGSGGE